MNTHFLVLVLYLTQIILNFIWELILVTRQESPQKVRVLLGYRLEQNCLLIVMYITEAIFFIISYTNSHSFFQSSVPSESTILLSPARVLVLVLCLLLNLLIQSLKILDLSISKRVVIGKVLSLMFVPSLETLFACAFCNHAARADTNSSSSEDFSAFCCLEKGHDLM